jgi:hypothetical protein
MVLFINLMAWAVLLSLPLFGIRRGSTSIFCIGLYIVLFSILVTMLAPSLADTLPPVIDADPAVNTGWWQLILFIPLFAASFPLGLFLNRFIGHSFEPFEEILGMFIGLVVGIIAVRILLGAVSMCAAESQLHAAIDHLFLVRQMVALDGFHGMQQWFSDQNRATELELP